MDRPVLSNGTNLQKTELLPRLPVPPMVGVRLKKTTTEVIRASVDACGGGKREACTEITRSAIKNAVEVLTNTEVEFHTLVVLTYPAIYPGDGRIVKAHRRAMLAAMEYKFGRFSNFTAQEYQKRGAVHLHIATSIDLAELGPVVRLKRNKGGRRKPTFETVKWAQDWLFETWVDIISKPSPAYNGAELDWAGLTLENETKMREAYYKHNAAISWEVMRDKAKAANYLVKELRGLKDYQKRVPENFSNPGRHFLYSRNVPFDERNAIEFAVTEIELREILSEVGWKYTQQDKPLYKHLWNTAADVAIKLIERGLRPIKGGLDGLKRFWDRRLEGFVRGDLKEWADWDAETRRVMEIIRSWEERKRKFINEAKWEFLKEQEPDRAGPVQGEFCFV